MPLSKSLAQVKYCADSSPLLATMFTFLFELEKGLPPCVNSLQKRMRSSPFFVLYATEVTLS